MVGVWWTEIVVVGVDRDSDDECLVDRLWQWIFGGQIVVVGVDRDCDGGCLVERLWQWMFGGQNHEGIGGGYEVWLLLEEKTGG